MKQILLFLTNLLVCIIFFFLEIKYPNELEKSYGVRKYYLTRPYHVYSHQKTIELMVYALRKGSLDEVGIKHDLSVLLAWLNAQNSGESTELINSVKQLLINNSDHNALNLLKVIEENYNQLAPNATFGPINSNTPGAAERLALLLQIGHNETSHQKDFYKGIDDFAKSSNFSESVFEVAIQVQNLLGANDATGGTFWRDEVIPAILQKGWQDNSLIAASSNEGPTNELKKTEAWLKAWLQNMPLLPKNGSSTTSDVYGFIGPKYRQVGYRAVAAHPIVIRLLREKIINDQDNSTKWICSWLAQQADTDPETAFSSGLIVLEAASKKGVTINDKGNLQGNPEWSTFARQVLNAIVVGSDSGQSVPLTWRNKHSRLNELFLICPASKRALLGRADLADVLRQYGQVRMQAAWNGFNTQAFERATKIANPATENIQDLVQQASQSRTYLSALMGNPLCAPWLPIVSQIDRPKSAEAGILLRWYMSQLNPRDLEQALEKHFEVIATNSNRLATSAEKLQALDDFSPWEVLRGAWIGKPINGTHDIPRQRSPWTQISESAVAAGYQSRLKDWLTNPLNTSDDSNKLAALSVVCWLGAQDHKIILRKLQEAIDNTSVSDKKLFLEACRLHLAVSVVLKGENLSDVLNDDQLLNASEIENLHQKVGDFYNDGRILSNRAAADITWLLGKRVISIHSPQLAESVVFTASSTTYPNIKDKQLRQTVRTMLQKLDPMLAEAIRAVRNDKVQSGLGLSLINLEIDINETISDASSPARKQRKDALAEWANVSLGPITLGTGFWGMETWLGHWRRELINLQNNRLLTVKSVVFKQPNLRRSTYRNLGGVMALLCGSTKLPFNGIGNTWQSLGSWSTYLEEKSSLTSTERIKYTMMGAVDTTVRLSSLPWYNSATPEGMLKLLIDRGSLLEAQTKKTEEPVDVDGLNEKYLPVKTWAAGINDLDEKVKELQRLEGAIRQQYNSLELQSSINSLKPLLSAPLVVNLSSFREELMAAVADVREAESTFLASQQESLAAELEVKAQELLTKVYTLEKQRTNVLLRIRENEVQLAQIGTQIADFNRRIAELKQNEAANKIEIAKLEEEIRKKEEEKKGIEVEIAASTVATLKNQLKLLEDLIYTPTPNPDDASKTLPGILGVVAYQAQKQVASQLQEIRNRKGELERQLADVREASFIKAITTFVGAIVGFVVGGPAGMQMGAMIGQAVGGIIAAVKQGRPFGEILQGSIRSGMQIAAASGVDVRKEFGQYASKNTDFGEAIGRAEQVIGPLLKDLPRYIDKKNLKEALTLYGADKSLQSFIHQVRDYSLAHLEQVGIPGINNELVKSIGGLALYGTSEEIRVKLKNEVLTALQTVPVNPALRKAAKDLGIALADQINEDKLKEQLAEKVATLGIVRVIPKLAAKRDQTLQRIMISLTSVQDLLRKNNFSSITGVIESEAFRKSVPISEYTDEIKWLKETFNSISLSVHQEIPWSRIQPKLQDALQEMLPNDPERRAMLLGQFRAQLDTDGMQAEIQRVLNPWNSELQRRLGEVDRTLAQPCTQDDDEDRIVCQIGVMDQGAQSLEGNVLNWLKDANSNEYKDLKKQISDKLNELQKAEANLKIANLNWKIAGDALKQAGFLKANAELQQEIAKIGVSVSTLASQQAEIALQNSDLEVRRVKLQAEQSLLNELISDTRKQASERLSKASKQKVAAAAANLDGAIARQQAAYNRSIVYGKIEGWYANVKGEEENQTIAELSKLINEHREQVEEAGRTVRDMLRLLRISGGNYTGFNLIEAERNWSDYIRNISSELNERYSRDLRSPQPLYFEWNLTSEQINQLFVASGGINSEGLSLSIEQFDPNELPSIVGKNPYMRLIPPRSSNERLFFIFIRGENEDDTPIDQAYWVPERIEHAPFAPILKEKEGFYERDFYLTKGKLYSDLSSWDNPIKENINRAAVNENIKSILGIADPSGTNIKEKLREYLGVPLTGRYNFKIKGRAPKRIKLVFVYISY